MLRSSARTFGVRRCVERDWPMTAHARRSDTGTASARDQRTPACAKGLEFPDRASFRISLSSVNSETAFFSRSSSRLEPLRLVDLQTTVLAPPPVVGLLRDLSRRVRPALPLHAVPSSSVAVPLRAMSRGARKKPDAPLPPTGSVFRRLAPCARSLQSHRRGHGWLSVWSLALESAAMRVTTPHFIRSSSAMA